MYYLIIVNKNKQQQKSRESFELCTASIQTII